MKSSPRLWLALWLGFVPVTNAAANSPAWWTQRGVLAPNANADDYAAANIGQVKWVASLAALEMQAKLPGGAGTDIAKLTASWALPPGPGVERDDYAAINLGQLKALAKLFYDRLAEFHYAGPPLAAGQKYPWTTATTDDADYAAANIGQVKSLFSFDLTLIDVTPPVISSLTASPSLLTPPTKKMVPVALTATVIDAGDPSPVTRIISVTSNEALDQKARSKPPAPDYLITGPMTLELRSEITGTADRIYTIAVESRDRSGNAATRTVSVTVRRGR
jgi:hypothetical protein